MMVAWPTGVGGDAAIAVTRAARRALRTRGITDNLSRYNEKKQFGVFTILGTLAIALVWAVPVHAELIDNGDGTVTQIRADGSRLMWLQDANLPATTGYFAYGMDPAQICPQPWCPPIVNRMTGMSWVDSLTWADTLDFAGYTDWRLPSAMNLDGSDPFPGYAPTGTGEMLDLAYNDEVSVLAPGPFMNLHTAYWAAEQSIYNHDEAYCSAPGPYPFLWMDPKINMSAQVGGQVYIVLQRRYALAVRDMAATECADGIDNDADGLIDLADPGCFGVIDPSERVGSQRKCGLGAEIAFLLPPLWWLHRRRWRR